MNETTINRMKALDRYLGIPAIQALRLVRPLTSRTGALTEVRRILMMKLWGLGNLVMIIPLIRAVRAHYPAASIHFLTLEGNRELLSHLPELDGLHTLRPKGLVRTLAELTRIAWKLREQQFDLIFDFEQFLRITPLLAGFSAAPQTLGFKTAGQARSSLFQVKVPYTNDRHMSLAFGDIVRSAGVSTHGLPPLEVPRSSEAAHQAEAFLQSHLQGEGPVVALHPGSGDNFPGRRWPVARFARLAERITRERGARCLITGTLPEQPLAEACLAQAQVPLINAVGRLDIMTFIELLARVDLLITNDTAPAHIGSALGIPLLAFFGPNTPELYGPLHPRSRSLYHRLPCSPCLTNMNAKTSSCAMPSCILKIDLEAAFDAAVELLDQADDQSLGQTEGDAS